MPAAISDDQALRYLEEATQARPNSLAAATTLAELSGWDSMGMVMFMGLVRDQGGVELSVYDLQECRSAGDLLRAIERRAH